MTNEKKSVIMCSCSESSKFTRNMSRNARIPRLILVNLFGGYATAQNSFCA